MIARLAAVLLLCLAALPARAQLADADSTYRAKVGVIPWVGTQQPGLLIGAPSTTFSANGTGIGINAPSGYAASLSNYQVAGVSQFQVMPSNLASTPVVLLPGTWFSGGTATTTKPQLLIEPSGTTSTLWNTSGTGIGVNAASGFSGNILDLQVAATRIFGVQNQSGATTLITQSLLKISPNGFDELDYGTTNANDWTFIAPVLANTAYNVAGYSVNYSVAQTIIALGGM